MIAFLHPQFIIENGKPAFAILPIEEYEKLLEELEDQALLHLYRKEKEEFLQHQELLTLEEVKQQL